eukprot:sb/3471612/
MARKKKKKDELNVIKEAEKKRAKRNRDLFRDIMQDLNAVLSTETLSTNKCLSTAVSILTLDKFCTIKEKSPTTSLPGPVELQHLTSADMAAAGKLPMVPFREPQPGEFNGKKEAGVQADVNVVQPAGGHVVQPGGNMVQHNGNMVPANGNVVPAKSTSSMMTVSQTGCPIIKEYDITMKRE